MDQRSKCKIMKFLKGNIGINFGVLELGNSIFKMAPKYK